MLSKKGKYYSRKYVCSPRQQLFNQIDAPQRKPLFVHLKKGSLTIEAAFFLPFFLMMLLAFFSFVFQYALAADLSMQAAAEARKVGIVLERAYEETNGKVVIYKSEKADLFVGLPFVMPKQITEKAVCRAWIGFTNLETEEMYVYITPGGSVYHLSRDCTHLKLSIERVTFAKACTSKNQYGQRYQECELCDLPFGFLVYITQEGNCYHSERNCSGLKRTIRQIPMSEIEERNCCIRCLSKEEK